MIRLIELLAITSILQVIVAEKLSIIEDVQTCTEYCFTNGSTGNFKDGNCVCENSDNTDAENAIRENKEAEYIDSDSNQLTNEDRTIRCVLKSKKHMRHNDGDRIVKYFLNNGPKNGHAYFTQAANQNIDPGMEKDNNKVNATNSYFNLDKSNSQTSDEQPLIANSQSKQSYGNAIVDPYVMANPYNIVEPKKSNMLSRRTSLRNNLIGAKLLPRNRSRTNIIRLVSVLHKIVQPVNENLLDGMPNNLTYQDPAVYCFNCNNSKNVNGNNIEKQVNSIVVSTNEDEKIPTVSSNTVLQKNIQRTYTSPINFQNIPYNQQYLTSIYPLGYLGRSPISGLYNTMPKAYILHPVMLQGNHFMEQSKVISPSQSQESVNSENDNSTNTDESASTS